MNFSDVELAALASGVMRIGVFFRLDVEPDPVRLWLGFGDIKPGADIYDPSGALYNGLGQINNAPAFKQLLNGAAERVEFTISGVSGRILEIASGDDSDAVKGRQVNVGFGLMDAAWALIGPVHWSAFYIADFISIDQQAADVNSPIVRTLALSCGTRFTGRRRPSLSYLSDPDQQRRFPGDLFCSLAKNYAHGFNKTWPTF